MEGDIKYYFDHFLQKEIKKFYLLWLGMFRKRIDELGEETNRDKWVCQLSKSNSSFNFFWDIQVNSVDNLKTTTNKGVHQSVQFGFIYYQFGLSI